MNATRGEAHSRPAMISECLALVRAIPPVAKVSLANNRVRRSTDTALFSLRIPPFCHGQVNLSPQITPTRLVDLTVSNLAIRPVMPRPTPKGWTAASSAPTTCGRVEPARAPLGTPLTLQISTEAHRGRHPARPVAIRILPMTILRAMVAEESRPSPAR